MKAEDEAKAYLNAIGFDSAHMEVHFNNDDNSYYEVFELMAGFAQEFAKANSQWISVDTPPPLPPKECKSHRYIVSYSLGRGSIFSGVGKYTYYGTWIVDGIEDSGINVTHWQPLPPPPTKTVAPNK